MTEKCRRCRWTFTLDAWDHAQAEGFDCPIHFEPEPTTPYRFASWADARLEHGDGPVVLP